MKIDFVNFIEKCKILDSHKRKTNKNKTVKIKSSRSSLASVSKINWEYVTGVSES